MHEPHASAHGHGDAEDPGYDREISYRRILEFIIGLAVLTAVAMVLMGMVVRGFTSQVTRQDPPPSPIPEANLPPVSPGPQLQFFPPTADIHDLHVWEDQMLHGYAWVDEQQGVARIPIERAMEILAQRGLPRAGAADQMSEELFGDRPEMSTGAQVGAGAPEGGS